MGIEAWALKESEKKKKEATEKEVSENRKKVLEHQKVKEKISVEVQAEEDLMDLKELVEKGVITKETAKKVVEGEEIDENTVKEIFEKIDRMDEIKDIDDYLPADLRVTKEEYQKALQDDVFRVQTITKLNSALTLIASKINPESAMWLNLFSWFLTVLDKNLILIQENTIDVKESLEEVDEKKFGKKEDNRSLWEKFLEIFK